jgi:AraC-like DNA-binding protein
MEMHVHAEGQLSCIEDGALRLQTKDGRWVVPKGRIIWIPARVRHAFAVVGESASWQLLLSRSMARLLPKEVCVLSVSPLLLASLEELILEQQRERSQKRIRALMAMIRCDLERAKPHPLGLQIPKDAGLRKATDSLLLAPADERGIDGWAKELGMSRRSFTRRFSEETGTSFAKWHRTLKLQRALESLAAGNSVSDVALELNESVSAFVAAFKKHYGSPPAQYVTSDHSAARP